MMQGEYWNAKTSLNWLIWIRFIKMMLPHIVGIAIRTIQAIRGPLQVRHILLQRKKWSLILMNFWWREGGGGAEHTITSQTFKNLVASCLLIAFKLRSINQRKIKKRHWKSWLQLLTKKSKRWKMNKSQKENNKNQIKSKS
jgi:hypothetical protein